MSDLFAGCSQGEQMYLGDKAFMEQAQKHPDKDHEDIEIPQILKRAPAGGASLLVRFWVIHPYWGNLM